MLSFNKYQFELPINDKYTFDLSRMPEVSAAYTNFQRMEIEIETPTTFRPVNEAKETVLLNAQGSNDQETHSKGCLTFCRKFSGLVINHLKAMSDLVESILKFNAEVMISLLYFLDFEKVDTSHLIELQAGCLMMIWRLFKENVTYSKNKKICIVKQEYWDIIFEKTTCNENFKKIIEEMKGSCKEPTLKSLLGDATFCSLLAQMLYYTNKLIALILLLTDSTKKAAIVRALPTLNNFIVLIVFPQHFRFYNHRGGKFALECCGKCKICRSKTLPKDFLVVLEGARRQTMMALSLAHKFVEEYRFNKFSSIFNLIDLAYRVF